MNEVIVGVDRSDTARRAAVRAVEVAQALDAPLHIVMAVKGGKASNVRMGTDQYHSDWLTDSEQFLEELKAELGVPDATSSIGDGDPSDVLCTEAERLGASMIVVGNRRMQGASRVLGAIAAHVAHHAPCDVLIAHTTG